MVFDGIVFLDNPMDPLRCQKKSLRRFCFLAFSWIFVFVVDDPHIAKVCTVWTAAFTQLSHTHACFSHYFLTRNETRRAAFTQFALAHTGLSH